jgi:misacylated tRNA(Ala) deacylase
MVLVFGCDRSKSSHIEKKKSKCDYILKDAPGADQIEEIESRVNELIGQNLPITTALVKHTEVPETFDLSKLPEDSSETLRLVYVSNYDVCTCIGQHVSNNSEIGTFRIISTDYSKGKLRIRFKLEN